MIEIFESEQLLQENYARKILSVFGSPSKLKQIAIKHGAEATVIEARKIIQKLGLRTRIDLVFGRFSRERDGGIILGQYNERDNEIYVNGDFFTDTEYPMPDYIAIHLVSGIIHEIMHAYQSFLFSKNGGSMQHSSTTWMYNQFLRGAIFCGPERSPWAMNVALQIYLDDKFSLRFFNDLLKEASRIGRRVADEIDFLDEEVLADPIKAIRNQLHNILKYLKFSDTDMVRSSVHYYALSYAAVSMKDQLVPQVQSLFYAMGEKEVPDNLEDVLNDVNLISYYKHIIDSTPEMVKLSRRSAGLVRKYVATFESAKLKK